MAKEKRGFFSHFRAHFITGIVVLLPLIGTIFIVKFIVSQTNNALLEPIFSIIEPAVGWADEQYLILAIKIVLFICIITLIVLLGMLVRNFFIQQLLTFGEGILLRVPVVNKIYSLIQQLLNTFIVKKKDIFNKVVLVEYPRKGIYILGLYTSKCEGQIAEKLPEDCVNVFIPTTPNPTSGFLIMLPWKDVMELHISVEDAMKIIVSGGVVTPRGNGKAIKPANGQLK